MNPKPLILVIPVVKNASLLHMHILIEKGYEKNGSRMKTTVKVT
jgi:hypothetical protein